MSRLLIIGGMHPTAVGNSLRRAAMAVPELTTAYVDSDQAHQAPRLIRALFWRLAGKRPPRLGRFNHRVLEECARVKPEFLICAGNIPLTAATVRQVAGMGCKTAVYLTDDPWNPAHRTTRFLAALPLYDWRLTPRKSILPDLARVSSRGNAYVPFGYEPELFHPAMPVNELPAYSACDVFFAGGADADRITPMSALLQAGMNVHLYGDMWARWKETAPAYRGYARPDDLSRMIAGAAVCLCMVRRANRDGQCMRTYELPAAGACMMVEDTAEHRELFGDDDAAVRYFTTDVSLVERTGGLLKSPHDRLRLKQAAHRLITEGRHAYADRLRTMLNYLSSTDG